MQWSIACRAPRGRRRVAGVTVESRFFKIFQEVMGVALALHQTGQGRARAGQPRRRRPTTSLITCGARCVRVRVRVHVCIFQTPLHLPAPSLFSPRPIGTPISSQSSVYPPQWAPFPTRSRRHSSYTLPNAYTASTSEHLSRRDRVGVVVSPHPLLHRRQRQQRQARPFTDLSRRAVTSHSLRIYVASVKAQSIRQTREIDRKTEREKVRELDSARERGGGF